MSPSEAGLLWYYISYTEIKLSMSLKMQVSSISSTLARHPENPQSAPVSFLWVSVVLPALWPLLFIPTAEGKI